MKDSKEFLNTNTSEYLSRYVTGCMKGFFAAMVLIHHLYQYTGVFKGTYIATILQALGYLSVSMFFFMSGYGLVASYYKKTQSYIKNFFCNRILPFFIIYTILTLIYAVFRIIMGENVSFMRVIKSYILGNTLVVNGWYLQVILLFYIFFWAIYAFIKKRGYRIAAMSVIVLLYCLVCRHIFESTTIFEAAPLFLLGMCWFEYKDDIEKVIIEKKISSFLTVLIVFAISFLICHISGSKSIVLATKMISAFTFVPLFLCIYLNSGSMISKLICNKLTSMLGKICLEIYVSQGIFLRLFRSDFISITNPVFYVVFVSICTVLLSILLNQLFSFTYKACSSYTKK